MHLIIGLITPKYPVPGTDFTGEVIAIGNQVKRFKKGDRVWGFNDGGKAASHAELMVFNENLGIERMPAGIPALECAASIEGIHYAYNFINKANLKAGETAMVNGGTGAIGSSLIQILRYHKVSVTATCRPEHSDVVKSLGAERTIDYTIQDFTQDTSSYDYVFDAVGKSSFGKCKRLLKKNGVFISSELGPYNENPFLALITPIIGGKKVKFPVPLNINRSLEYAAELLEKGGFKPLIDKEYALEDIRKAYAYVLSGQKVGNVILNLRQEG